MSVTHGPRASRRLTSVRLLMATVCGVGMIAGCSDSAFGPTSVNPVGRYELVGCTYGADTVAAHIESECGTGGSNHFEVNSETVEINADGTVTRTLVVTNTANGAPTPYSSTTVSHVAGTWKLDGRVLEATWNGLGYAATTEYTRADANLIRENDTWNEYIYFWFRRTR